MKGFGDSVESDIWVAFDLGGGDHFTPLLMTPDYAVTPLDARRVDPQQDVDAVPGPFGYLSRVDAAVRHVDRRADDRLPGVMPGSGPTGSSSP